MALFLFMPIPEPARFKPSNLTREQRRTELAACYGVHMQEQLTYAELERMRQIVQSADAQRQPMKTIDLNNPPREPYHFQSFPKMVYDLENSVPGKIAYLVVQNGGELSDAIASGYSLTAPSFGDAPEEILSAKYQAEASNVQQEIERVRQKPGPKPRIAV